MKKLLTVLIAVALVFSFAGCNGSSKGYELALVTDVGHIDDQSFNQGAAEHDRPVVCQQGGCKEMGKQA